MGPLKWEKSPLGATVWLLCTPAQGGHPPWVIIIAARLGRTDGVGLGGGRTRGPGEKLEPPVGRILG